MSNVIQWPKAKYFVGADGSVFTLGDLPAPNTKRWTMRRKTEVVEGVRRGLITVEDACWRYSLTTEEFRSWKTAIERFGTPGLNLRRAQDDRRVDREAVILRFGA